MKLEWKDSEPSSMTWYKADELSEEWKLPTLKQIRDAFNNKTKGFEDKCYWVKDEKEDDLEKAWYFDFENNESSNINKNFYFLVRFCREVK